MKKSVVELVISALFFALGFLGMGLTSLFYVFSNTIYSGYHSQFLGFLRYNHLSWFFVLSIVLFLLGLVLLVHCWMNGASLYTSQEKKAEEHSGEVDSQKEEKTEAFNHEMSKFLLILLGLILAAMIIFYILIMMNNFS